MRAWVQERYGPVDTLEWREVAYPSFRDPNELLVKVYATSVNPADRHGLKPPIFLRRGQGWLRPRTGRPGLDFVGRVEVVGSGVTEWHVGDEVFGVATGAFGEYAIADRTQVAVRPTRLSAEQCAAVPIAAVTALQGLRNHGKVTTGTRVLVNGASGGVGTFAVQIARSLGANVTAVCSARNVDQARSLGAHRVLDYGVEDFTKSGERWDVIFDTQVNHPLSAYRRVLSPNGVLLMIGAGAGSVGKLLPKLLKTMLVTRLVGPPTKFFVASVKTAELLALRDLLERGEVVPVIDRQYPIAQLPDALRYLIEGHARGKIVVTV
jgi:NADPH:quinone reductase-like Zn-dependent oxidoreductase